MATRAALLSTDSPFVAHRLTSSFSSSREQTGRTKPHWSAVVRVVEENSSVRFSWKKRFESGRSLRTSLTSSVLFSFPKIGEDHGNSKPKLNKQTSNTVRRSDEQKGTLPDEEGRTKFAFEESSPGRKRVSSEGPAGTTAGKSLEDRLLQRLSLNLKDRHLLHPGQKVLLAVSGGQDSVCLMHLLVKLQSKWEWKIGVAHCDHQWSSSARSQAAHVAQMAQGLGLDYYQALTTEPVLGEGVARTWRYGILQRIAVSKGYEVIATAHTASDRIETLLFNIFRGTGLQGLQSLTWKRSLSPELALARHSAFQVTDPIVGVVDPRDGNIAMSTSSISLIRPLLDVTRTELRDLWEELKLPLWPDPSNLSLDIDRNRIRHQLLPYLRKHFNPGVDKALARWAEILHGEQVYLDNLCESIRGNAESEFAGPPEDGGRRLDVSLLRSLPIALQRRILKQFTDGFTGKSLGFDSVERVRRACADVSSVKKGLRVSVPGGYYLHIRGDELIVARYPQKEPK